MSEISIRLHIISIAISVGFVFYVLMIVRKGILRERDSLLWLFVGSGFIILALFPQSLMYVAKVMDIGLGIHTLFLISSLIAFVLLFQHSISISKSKESNKKLIQELALLKAELKKITSDNQLEREEQSKNTSET